MTVTFRPKVVCVDGFSMSVQASNAHYCSPAIDNAAEYDAVEVGLVSELEPLLLPYRVDGVVYACVPVSVVEQIIEKHGGSSE